MNDQSNHPQSRTRLIVITALFAAFIYVTTAFFEIRSFDGFTHIGDGIIYLAASVLPAPYAIAASVIGAGLADLTLAPAWIPATIVIKALTALCFSYHRSTILCKRNLLALVPAFLLCAGGYYCYYAIVILNSFVGAIPAISGYCVQVLLSSIVYLLAGSALDKIQFKKRLKLIFPLSHQKEALQ